MGKLQDNLNEIQTLQDEIFWRLEDDDYKDFLVQSLAMKKGEQADTLAWLCDTHLMLASEKFLALHEAEAVMKNRKDAARRAVDWIKAMIENTAKDSGIAHIRGEYIEWAGGKFDYAPAPSLLDMPDDIAALLEDYSENVRQQAVYKDLLDRSKDNYQSAVGRGESLRERLMAALQEQGLEKATNGVLSVRVDKGREAVNVLDARALPDHLKTIVYHMPVQQSDMEDYMEEGIDESLFTIKPDAKAIKEAIKAGEVAEDVAVIVKNPFVVIRGA